MGKSSINGGSTGEYTFYGHPSHDGNPYSGYVKLIHGWMAIAFYGTMARVKIYAPPKMNQFDCGLRKNMDT